MSKSWLLSNAMRTYNEAMRAGQPGAAKACLELAGKLSGHLVERKELRVVRSWEDLTDDEVNALAGSAEED